MGESSTCLVRSFSTPADTCSKEENPIRMLGESISFGRFMSESLDWEKWSAFSQNRYVEEAEKYSKPGSVAAKKAYFEAHYKKKAAEKAAALIEEANAQANGTFDSETQEGNCIDSSLEMRSKTDNTVTANEQLDKDTVNFQVVDCANTNQSKCDIGQSDFDILNVDRAKDVPHPRIDTNLNVENCMLVDNSNQFDHVEVLKNIAVPVEERMTDPGTAGEEVLALPLKGKQVNSSEELSNKTRAATKLTHSLDKKKAAASVPPRSGTNCGSKSKKLVGDSAEKKRLTAGSVHMSINLPGGAGEKSKTVAAAVQSRNGINSFSTSKKSVGGSVEKRRITAQSLYKSINLPSSTGVTSKTATAAVKPRNGINHASKSMKSVGDSIEKRPVARSNK
ncbi:protein WVD2-like 7 [Gastrolobium bilobum]|uniref:protein WVD2-like 7 n=1 Tax=Gastrolobium bilobum TaxID=150636 RepID=UPI002AB28EF3|nr:protein WVD2-like 7 [Gastrolobium bilobum]